MREKSTFVDDEFKEIAEGIFEQFARFFPEDFDLSRFFFIRTEGIKPKWISKVRKIGHPWGSLPGLENIIYLIETSADNWNVLNDAQKSLVVFHEMKHIPEGGCDFDSSTCGKLVEHPVQDFPECIAAANGNLFWAEVGHGEELPNILNSGSKFNLEESLKRTGFIPDDDKKIDKVKEFSASICETKPEESTDETKKELLEESVEESVEEDKDKINVEEI